MSSFKNDSTTLEGERADVIIDVEFQSIDAPLVKNLGHFAPDFNFQNTIINVSALNVRMRTRQSHRS